MVGKKITEKKLLAETKAQSEAVFRIMVDSVVGLVILVIIISSISYFNDQTIAQSWADFRTLVESAVNSPDGSIIASKTLSFAQGNAIATDDLQDWMNYPAKCFSFQTNYSSIEIIDSKQVTFKHALQTRVYAKCTSGDSCNIRDPQESCCINCVISFGSEIK
ncbi:MAG: hypothetical protein WCW13_02465 [archaeon]|jgi:hypothetical protein